MKLPLTISLLASNRITTLERCLDSLKPLLLEIPAELLVVFTGTDERVRQVAKRYTDQIVPFTWCNDFSAARNAGLKHAKGEWFLYLDDDEWFEDVREICDFFRSGEYLRYRSASYVSRNYSDWNGTKYTEFAAYRMARRTPDLHFENPVHEELHPCHAPCKELHSYVHHYGYIKDTQKVDEKKRERNISLLLKDMEERPEYTKNHVQLTQEYVSQGEWEKAEEACRRGRSVCKDTEFLYESWLQTYLIEILYKKEDYAQAWKDAISILENEKPNELTRLILYSLLVGIGTETKKFEEIIEYGIAFEKLLEDMEKKPELWLKQRFGTMSRDKVMTPEWLNPVRMGCIKAALELKKWEKAAYFLGLLPWEEEYRIQQYYPLLDQWKETYAPHMAELLVKQTSDSPYLLIQKLFLQEQSGQEEEADLFLFRRCLKEIENPYLQCQLVEKALLEQKDFSVLLERMDLDNWKECVEKVMSVRSYEEALKLWEARKTLFHAYPLHGLWLEKLLWEKELMMGFQMKDQLLLSAEEYAKCIQAFYAGQYQEAMFEENCRSLLPADCRMALIVLEALNNWRQGELAKTVRLLRQGLRIYPRMTGVVRELLRLLNMEAEHPAPVQNTEFGALAVQMKTALNAMIESGQYREAMPVLSQLLPLMPNDMELLKMHQVLLKALADS